MDWRMSDEPHQTWHVQYCVKHTDTTCQMSVWRENQGTSDIPLVVVKVQYLIQRWRPCYNFLEMKQMKRWFLFKCIWCSLLSNYLESEPNLFDLLIFVGSFPTAVLLLLIFLFTCVFGLNAFFFYLFQLLMSRGTSSLLDLHSLLLAGTTIMSF